MAKAPPASSTMRQGHGSRVYASILRFVYFAAAFWPLACSFGRPAKCTSHPNGRLTWLLTTAPMRGLLLENVTVFTDKLIFDTGKSMNFLNVPSELGTAHEEGKSKRLRVWPAHQEIPERDLIVRSRHRWVFQHQVFYNIYRNISVTKIYTIIIRRLVFI